MLSKTSRRWVIPLYLIVGLLFSTTPAEAQSRGESKGRSTKTEQKESGKASSSRSTRSGSSSASKSSRTRPSSGSSASRSSNERSSQRSRSEASSRSQSSNTRSSQSGRSRSSDPSRSSSRVSNSKSGQASSSGRSSRSGQSAGQSSRSSSSSSTRTRDAGQSAGSSSSSSRSSRTDATRNDRSSRGSSGSTTGRSSRQTSPQAGSSSSRDRDNSGTRSRERSSAGDSRQRSGDNRIGSTDRGRQDVSSRDSRQRSGDSRIGSTDRGRQDVSSRGTRDTTPSRGTTSTRRDDVRGRTTQDQNTRISGRRDNTRVYIHPNKRQHTTKRRVYDRRNYVYPKRHKTYRVKPHLVISPVYYHRPHVHINIDWPWQNRYYRNWNPHYRYKQVVYVNIGHGSKYRRSRVDVRTEYQQQVRYADHHKAVIDIYLDKIEVYEDGYYYGEVYRIPDHLSHIEATVYRNGDVVYDRDVFLVGNPYDGFEMISTRNYDGYVLDYYDRSHGYKVGKLDFRRKRVYSRRHSKLFDPYGYNGHAPISLLPEDRYLADYGYDSVSYNYYNDDYDPYYGGSYDDDYYDYYDDGSYYKYDAPRGKTYGRSPNTHQAPYSKQSVQARIAASGPIKLNDKQTINTRAGIAINLEREGQLERIR